MGACGNLPWENDGAADWFGSLFDKTKLARHVEDTLKLNAEDTHEEIRAAASVLLFLGRHYIWQVHDLDRHLILAAEQLEKVSSLSVITESPGLTEEIGAEIRELRSRIKTPNPSQEPEIKPKKWWQFWS